MPGSGNRTTHFLRGEMVMAKVRIGCLGQETELRTIWEAKIYMDEVSVECERSGNRTTHFLRGKNGYGQGQHWM
jgi:hypothetical protein